MGGTCSCMKCIKGDTVLCTITNKYSERIWVKHDVEKKYAVMEDYTIKGGVGVDKVSVSLEKAGSKTYDWVKIQAQFTPIPSGEFIELAVDCKDSEIMYVTIIGDDQEIICNTLGQVDKNLIVTENGLLRSADEKNFTEVNPKFEEFKLNPTASGPVNKNTASAVTGNTSTNRAGEQASVNVRRNISQLIAKKSGSIDITSGLDSKFCDIKGMAVTNNGTILLADCNNVNIKSVSSDEKIVSVLSLPAIPWNITVLDTTTAVAAAKDKKLYILDITDHTTLSVRDEYQLEYFIWAMTHYNGNLVVTCVTDPKSVKMITTDGNDLWSVSKDDSGENLFGYPRAITTTTISDTDVIVVADDGKNTLTLLDAKTGRFIRIIDVEGKMPLGRKLRTIDMEGKGPQGITADNDGNVYVCYSNTREICVWSPDFKESKILLSGDEIGRYLKCIVYSGINDSLYVSYYDCSHKRNTFDCFRLV